MPPSLSRRIRRGCPGADRSPLASGAPQPCAFLDRDGVLNLDKGYVHSPEDFVWMPGAREALDALTAQGWWTVVVTNQSGVERGFYTEEDLVSLSLWMLQRQGLDLILYCPHLEGCPARKPGRGMLDAAAEILPIDRSQSVMVGDKPTDMQAAAAAGVRGLRFSEALGPLDAFLSSQGVL